MHEHPHLGIMHEVYAAPPGSWENISVNFAPFGMGELGHCFDHHLSFLTSPISFFSYLFFFLSSDYINSKALAARS